MYRFLATPRWLGLAALMGVAAAVMVALGNWQFDRYHEKAAINDRIAASTTATPAPSTDVMPVGAAAATRPEYTRVTATGTYDPGNEVLVRLRSLDGRVGYEVLTPLRLADGTAVLVDRGWTASVSGLPAAPGGQVTVSGAVRRPERGGVPARRDGRLEVRGIDPVKIASVLPYPVRGGYVTVPDAAEGLTPVPPHTERTWQNAGYAVQWWAFALLTVVGFGYLARREAREPERGPRRRDRLELIR